MIPPPAYSDRTALGRAVLARAGFAVAMAMVVLACFGVVPAAFALLAGAAVTGLGWAQTRFGDGPAATAARLLLIAAEVTIVTVAVFAGDPLGPRLPAPLVFASPSLICLLALIAVNAATVRPLAVWWAGSCVAAAWGLAAAFTRADPATITKFQINDDNYPTLISYLEAVTQPHFFSLDALALQFAVIAGCTAILGVAAHRMRALARSAAGRYAARSSLAAHFSSSVVETLLDSRGAGAPGSRRIAALDCDLVSFTAWAARTEAEDVARALRAYHAFVEDRVFAHGGAVLKYVGDGVVAVFGLTGSADGVAAAALGCAKALSREWPAAARDLFGRGYAASLAVGVDYGEAMAGLTGEGRAMCLVVVGAPLDSAAELQASRPEGVPVVIGADAVEAARAHDPSSLDGFAPLPTTRAASWGLASTSVLAPS